MLPQYLKRLVVVGVISAALSLSGVMPGEAQTVPQKTASWDANTEPDLNGYKLYMAAGTCASPGNFVTVATFPKTATSGLVPNPTADGAYCFRLTAFDTASNESPFSTSVQRDFNVVPPVAPGAFTITP